MQLTVFVCMNLTISFLYAIQKLENYAAKAKTVLKTFVPDVSTFKQYKVFHSYEVGAQFILHTTHFPKIRIIKRFLMKVFMNMFFAMGITYKWLSRSNYVTQIDEMNNEKLTYGSSLIPNVQMNGVSGQAKFQHLVRVFWIIVLGICGDAFLLTGEYFWQHLIVSLKSIIYSVSIITKSFCREFMNAC